MACKFSLHITWNRTTVMLGHCSATMGADVAESYFRDNFAGPEFRAWFARTFPQGHVLTALEGDGFSAAWADETGDAEVRLSRVER